MSDLVEYREYYGKGQIRARYMQRNGLLEGEALFYAENGQLIQRSSFKAGQLHGEMLIYDREGRLIQRSYYHEGKLEMPVLLYDEDGFVIRRLSFKHDLVDGEAIAEAPEEESRPEKMRLDTHSDMHSQQA